MKVIFMGTPDFAIPCLERLAESNHNVLAVITQPDRPKGRGKKVLFPPVKEKAIELGIDVLQPLKVKEYEFINELKKYEPDCIVVVAYGQILSKEILDLPKYGCINVHASLLPKYRGAAPINWAIINGEKVTGVTTMYMDEGLDTGDMLLKKEILVNNKTAGELHDEMSVLGGELLIETLDKIESNSIERIKQDNSISSYAPLLNKELGRIEWTKSAQDIYNLVRGLNPWPIAHTTYKGTVFKVLSASVINEFTSSTPGEILNVSKTGIEVASNDEIVLIEKIQFPNKKAMTVDEYLRGNEIEKGIVLGE